MQTYCCCLYCMGINNDICLWIMPIDRFLKNTRKYRSENSKRYTFHDLKVCFCIILKPF